MALSPNYGFPEPDNSSLVKNGAQDIRALGDAVDALLFRPFTKNAVINGGFDVWQRSTSATFAGTLTYTSADRFFGVCTGTAPTCTMSRQTADTTGLTYGMRFGRNSGQTNTGAPFVGTAFESLDAKRFAGQTVTLSFYVKAGANAPLLLTSQIRTGTGTDQSAASLFSVGWTGGANNSQANTVTTTMTRYTQTVTLGSTVNQIMLLFTYTPTGTAGANEWFQIEGVQLEVGNQVSPFIRAGGGSIQGELAACQRYYYRTTSIASSTDNILPLGMGISATEVQTMGNFPVRMRTFPTAVEWAGLRTYDGTTFVTVTGVTLGTSTFDGYLLSLAGASGMVQYRPTQTRSTSSSPANSFVGFSAEL
jgi:hypothetical protein